MQKNIKIKKKRYIKKEEIRSKVQPVELTNTMKQSATGYERRFSQRIVDKTLELLSAGGLSSRVVRDSS